MTVRPVYRPVFGTRITRRCVTTVVLAFAVVICVVAVTGCACSNTTADDATILGPVQVVDELLHLRAKRSTDASAYAEYVADTGLAIELAQAAVAEADTTVTPTPEWEPPYVSAEDGLHAEVIVVWVSDDAHPDWPGATVFSMILDDGRWCTVDAQPVE